MSGSMLEKSKERIWKRGQKFEDWTSDNSTRETQNLLIFRINVFISCHL